MIVKLDWRLHDILIRDSTDQFTTVELRDAYVEKYDASGELDPTETWNQIDRQMNRLVKHGFLVKQEGPNYRRSTYSKTPEFRKAKFHLSVTAPRPQKKEEQKASGPLDDQLLLALRDRAQQYQADLSACVGESEEYAQLYDVYPDLKPQLEPQYLKAKSRSSRLLGQLRAIENILADCETHT